MMDAHSKSQYKRLVAQGVDVPPPAAPTPDFSLLLATLQNVIDGRTQLDRFQVATVFECICQLERSRDEARRQLEEAKELETMRAVAISTASTANTDASWNLTLIEQGHQYWTIAYQDVKVAVHREIKQRERAEQAESDARELWAALHYESGRCFVGQPTYDAIEKHRAKYGSK